MPLSLVAAPNPVIVWGRTPGPTTIRWDTGSTARGRVEVSVNGGPPAVVGGGAAGAATGQVVHLVRRGENVDVVLRRASDGRELARTQVTADDQQDDLQSGLVAALALRDRLDPPQWISDLMISPLVDTVTGSFRTNRPTIPLVELQTLTGERIDARFAVLGGLRTKHHFSFGEGQPLPQRTTLRITVTVPGRKPLIGQAKDVTASALFTTGSRSVNVSFHDVVVRTDADPGLKGAGELTFDFRVGDLVSPADEQWAEPWRGDISAGDPPHDLGRTLDEDLAPRSLYLEVTGRESDVGFPIGGLDIVGRAGDRRLGTGAREDERKQEAWVATVVDLGSLGLGRHHLPITLATGDYALAYTVRGGIFCWGFPGTGWYSVLRRPEIGAAGLITTEAGYATVTSPQGMTAQLAKDDAGRLWLRARGAAREDGRNGWVDCGPAVGDSVTVVHRGADLLLLGRDDERRVSARILDPSRPESEWSELGTGFGELAAIVDAAGDVAVFAVMPDGLTAGALPRDAGTISAELLRGQPVGAEVAGEVVPVNLADGGLAVFAVTERGDVGFAFRHPDSNRWEPWQPVPGSPAAGWIGVTARERGGVAVAVCTDDRQLVTLEWPDFPDTGDVAWNEGASADGWPHAAG